MIWCYIKDNEVVYKGELPQSFDGVSNLNLKSKEELLKLGWRLYDKEKITAGHEYEFIVHGGWKITDEKATETFKIEKISLDMYKQKQIQKLKNNAYTIITAHYPLYKQINSALGIYTDEEIQEIKDVIQAVRDEYHKKKDIIKNASDYDEIEKVITRIEYFDKDKQINENTIPEGED